MLQNRISIIKSQRALSYSELLTLGYALAFCCHSPSPVSCWVNPSYCPFLRVSHSPLQFLSQHPSFQLGLLFPPLRLLQYTVWICYFLRAIHYVFNKLIMVLQNYNFDVYRLNNNKSRLDGFLLPVNNFFFSSWLVKILQNGQNLPLQLPCSIFPCLDLGSHQNWTLYSSPSIHCSSQCLDLSCDFLQVKSSTPAH